MTPPLLYDINLETCSDDCLLGHWRLQRRGPGPATVFSLCDELILEASATLIVRSIEATYTGTWAVERDPRLHRPYLLLALPEEQTNALVTRLQRTADGRPVALTLYFKAGTEVVLRRVEVA